MSNTYFMLEIFINFNTNHLCSLFLTFLDANNVFKWDKCANDAAYVSVKMVVINKVNLQDILISLIFLKVNFF